MKDKIKAARVELGRHFQERRQQMGRTTKELANFLNISSETVKGVETGRFPFDVDLLFRFCAALEIKPFFAPHEELGIDLDTPPGEKFLLCPDGIKEQLFILHRQYPACLIQIVQTVPVTFRIVDLYDDIEESGLVTHPFLEEAKSFFRQYVANNESKN